MFSEAFAYRSPYTDHPEHLPNATKDLTTIRARVCETLQFQTESKQPTAVSEFREYVNGTGVTLYIRNRNGVVIELPTDLLAQGRGLLVRSGYTVKGQSRLEPGELVPERKVVGKANFDVRGYQSEILNNQLYRDQNYGITQYEVHRNYLITSEELHIALIPGKNLGRITQEYATYIANLDIVVSNHPNIPLHPGQEELQYVGIKDRVVSKTEPGVMNHIAIVDNNQEFGDHFIQWQGVTQRVVAQKDTGRQDGVYVNRMTIGPDGKPTTNDPPEYYSFDEAEQLDWLYKHKREAERLGGAVEQERRSLEQAKERQDQINERLEQERHRYAMMNSQEARRKERAELDVKLQKAQQELSMLQTKAETAYREHQYTLDRLAYEQRVEIQKQQTEAIKLRNEANKAHAEKHKWLLPLLGLFTGLLTLLKKSK